MDIDLRDVMRYCRIDDEEEAPLVIGLIQSAKAYLANAGVPEPEEDSPLYLLAVKAMTLHFYDHRGMTEDHSSSAIPGMSNTITQLKLVAEAERIVGGGS